MSKEIKDLSRNLITEIQKLVDYIDCSNEYENEDFEDFQDNSTYTNEQKLQKQESWYDQTHEKYLQIANLYEIEQKMK